MNKSNYKGQPHGYWEYFYDNYRKSYGYYDNGEKEGIWLNKDWRDNKVRCKMFFIISNKGLGELLWDVVYNDSNIKYYSYSKTLHIEEYE